MYDKKMLIINPPDFSNYIFEKNILCNDGLFVIDTLIKSKYPNISTKVIDFDFLKLGIFDIFDELDLYKPDYVYVNLNSYNYFSSSHLCIGIKKHCPNCKIIVGLNISDKSKKEFDKRILDCIDYWLDYDLSSLKITSDLNSGFYFFNKKKYYKNIYFYNKTKKEIIDEINLNIINNCNRFILRGTNDFSYEDLKFILNNSKKHFKFILENDIIDIYQINELYKKYHMKGIILNLNKKVPLNIHDIKPFVFFRIYIQENNFDLYKDLKKNNLIYLDIFGNDFIHSEFFKSYRIKELIEVYKENSFFEKNSKYFFNNPTLKKYFLDFVYFFERRIFYL